MKWTDYRFTSIVNQKLVWCEFNDITKTIFYDQRIAISEPREVPVVWSCSKVEDMNVKGIARYTFAQDKWDPEKDYIETDAAGNVIGMWCGWNDIPIEPKDSNALLSPIRCVISYAGAKPELKIGGSYKKFTVTFYKDNEVIETQRGDWKFTIDDQDATALLDIKTEASDLNDDQIKIKFKGDEDYIDKILKVKYESAYGIKGCVEINLIGI